MVDFKLLMGFCILTDDSYPLSQYNVRFTLLITDFKYSCTKTIQTKYLMEKNINNICLSLNYQNCRGYFH